MSWNKERHQLAGVIAAAPELRPSTAARGTHARPGLTEGQILRINAILRVKGRTESCWRLCAAVSAAVQRWDGRRVRRRRGNAGLTAEAIRLLEHLRVYCYSESS